MKKDIGVVAVADLRARANIVDIQQVHGRNGAYIVGYILRTKTAEFFRDAQKDV